MNRSLEVHLLTQIIPVMSERQKNHCTIKDLRTFWRILELPSINCDVDVILNWSGNCKITTSRVNSTFKMMKQIST